MGLPVYKFPFEGFGAITASATAPGGGHYRVVSLTCHFSGAPTTSEDFTISLDAHAGAVYDTRLLTYDPSVGAATDIVWYPDETLWVEGGGGIYVGYTNTDAVTYGVQITMEGA